MGTEVAGSGHRSVRAFTAERPLTTFLVLVFGIGWAVLTLPILAHYDVLPGKDVPIEVYALTTTLLVLLPSALWVTSVVDGRAGVRALLGRALRWRFSPVWYLAILVGLPALSVLAGVVGGASLSTADLASSILGQLVQVLLAALIINIWEETAWAGFFQTRLEQRHSLLVAAALTAIPFAGIHLPLLLVDDQNLLTGYGRLVLLGVLVRLMMGVTLRATGDSVLAVGLLHSVFNQTNNASGILGDLLVTGVDRQIFVVAAAALFTGLVALAARGRLGRRAASPPGSADTGAAGTRARTG